jgi:hypothetical protein
MGRLLAVNTFAVDPSFNNLSDEPECVLPDCIASYYFNEENDLFLRLDGGSWIRENNRNDCGVWYYTDVEVSQK